MIKSRLKGENFLTQSIYSKIKLHPKQKLIQSLQTLTR